jgi:hypothetical protein
MNSTSQRHLMLRAGQTFAGSAISGGFPFGRRNNADHAAAIMNDR